MHCIAWLFKLRLPIAHGLLSLLAFFRSPSIDCILTSFTLHFFHVHNASGRWSTIDELCCAVQCLLCICVILLKVCYFFHFSKWVKRDKRKKRIERGRERERDEGRRQKKEIHIWWAIVIFTYARHWTPTLSQALLMSRSILSLCFILSLSSSCTNTFSSIFPRRLWHYLSLDQFTNNSMEFHMKYTHFKLWSFRLGDTFLCRCSLLFSVFSFRNS